MQLVRVAHLTAALAAIGGLKPLRHRPCFCLSGGRCPQPDDSDAPEEHCSSSVAGLCPAHTRPNLVKKTAACSQGQALCGDRIGALLRCYSASRILGGFQPWFGCVALTDSRKSGEPCSATSPQAKCAGRISLSTKILDLPEKPAVITIDVPIGLPEVTLPGGRSCDRLARRLLGSRGSSVFSPMGRICLQVDNREKASHLHIGRGGIGIGAQCWGLKKKLLGQCHGNSDSSTVHRRLASSDETDIV